MKTLIAVLAVSLCCSACNKDYTCVCSNPGGEYKAFSVKATQAKAEQKCSDYYNDNFGSVPWNETHCEIR